MILSSFRYIYTLLYHDVDIAFNAECHHYIIITRLPEALGFVVLLSSLF